MIICKALLLWDSLWRGLLLHPFYWEETGWKTVICPWSHGEWQIQVCCPDTGFFCWAIWVKVGFTHPHHLTGGEEISRSSPSSLRWLRQKGEGLGEWVLSTRNPILGENCWESHPMAEIRTHRGREGIVFKMMGVPWWIGRLRIWYCHSCDLGHYCGACSIPGLRTSTGHGRSKKKKKRQTDYFSSLNFWWSYTLTSGKM